MDRDMTAAKLQKGGGYSAYISMRI